MRSQAFSTAVVAAVLFVTALCSAPGRALGGPHDVVIYVTRLGGDPDAAQPYITQFLSYLETAMGWPAGSSKGVFVDSKKEALSFIDKQQPGLGVIEPALYLELRKGQGLLPIAQVSSTDLLSEKLHVVVKDPALKVLDDLKGKTLDTILSDFSEYLSRVVLAGKVDAATFFKLKHVGQAMKGVRAVLRGDADATLLDDEQLEAAKKIEGGGQLHSVFDAHSLPPLPVVAFGKNSQPDDRKKLVRVLLEMCGTPKGGQVCKDMHIAKFAPINGAAILDAQKLYDRP